LTFWNSKILQRRGQPVLGSPPDGVEERRDRAVHGVWLLLVHHVTGVIDNDEP
jgi:hypothetical protein